jgi:hypothetical protein
LVNFGYIPENELTIGREEQLKKIKLMQSLMIMQTPSPFHLKGIVC